MLSFFIFNPIGKIIAGIVGVMFLIGLAWGALAIHDNGVRNAALLEANNKQLAETVANQQLILQNMEKLNKVQNEIIAKVTEQNRQLENNFAKIDRMIDDARPEAVSPLLQNIIRELRNSR